MTDLSDIQPQRHPAHLHGTEVSQQLYLLNKLSLLSCNMNHVRFIPSAETCKRMYKNMF
jgi:hypothetical protein